MNKEDFAKYYDTLSTVELLKILQEKSNYQPHAIEAAEEILSKRNYDNDDLKVARAEVDVQLNKKREKKEAISRQIDQAADFIDENFGIKKRTPAKMLNVFCVGITVYTLLTAIPTFKTLSFVFDDKVKGYLFAALVYMLQFVLIYLLYRRSNWGWVIFIFIAGLLGMGNIGSLISSFQSPNQLFFIPVNRGVELFSLMINIAIIVFLSSKKIVTQFTISKQGRDTTFILLAVIGGLYFIVEYFL